MPPPEPSAPGIFAMAEPERITELVTGAGFGAPSIDEVAVDWRYSTPEEHWAKTLKLAAPIAEAVDALEPAEQERVRELVGERIAEQLEGAGIAGQVHVVMASPA